MKNTLVTFAQIVVLLVLSFCRLGGVPQSDSPRAPGGDSHSFFARATKSVYAIGGTGMLFGGGSIRCEKGSDKPCG